MEMPGVNLIYSSAMDPIRIITGIWVAVGILWLIGASGVKRAERSQSTGSRMGQLGMMTAAFLLLVDSRLRIGFLGWRFLPASSVTSDAGLAMVILGAAFAVWARMCLGANWSARVTLKEGHELIRTGPYALVRHPIYSGLLLAVLGTAVAIGRIGCLVAFALAVIGWRMKWRTEERFMSEQFGTRYENYRKEVKGLIPWVV
jgi:protein-S-isoprenylcysteine O-methyltransferase Ste14